MGQGLHGHDLLNFYTSDVRSFREWDRILGVPDSCEIWNKNIMQQLNAAQRIRAATLEEAAFDGSRVHELSTLAKQLQAKGLTFRLADARLVRECPIATIVEDVTRCAEVMIADGWGLQVDYPTIFKRPTFGLKGDRGIVLQKVNTTLRIFFTR